MATSTIEWTDATWNPVAGCTVLSPGCANCYAMRMAARLGAIGQAKYQSLTHRSGDRHVWNGAVRCDEASLEIPLRWRKPRFVFVNSMSDLFHPDVPESFIAKVWRTMAAGRQHTFQILTKRPERMQRLAEQLALLPNVWLGTSVETSDYLWRLGELRATRAVLRFASFEPLLGPVTAADLSGIHWARSGRSVSNARSRMSPSSSNNGAERARSSRGAGSTAARGTPSRQFRQQSGTRSGRSTPRMCQSNRSDTGSVQ